MCVCACDAAVCRLSAAAAALVAVLVTCAVLRHWPSHCVCPPLCAHPTLGSCSFERIMHNGDAMEDDFVLTQPGRSVVETELLTC
eukprot:34800-Eustigmatos_ZCMA.PRE.1